MNTECTPVQMEFPGVGRRRIVGNLVSRSPLAEGQIGALGAISETPRPNQPRREGLPRSGLERRDRSLGEDFHDRPAPPLGRPWGRVATAGLVTMSRLAILFDPATED